MLSKLIIFLLLFYYNNKSIYSVQHGKINYGYHKFNENKNKVPQVYLIIQIDIDTSRKIKQKRNL